MSEHGTHISLSIASYILSFTRENDSQSWDEVGNKFLSVLDPPCSTSHLPLYPTIIRMDPYDT